MANINQIILSSGAGSFTVPTDYGTFVSAECYGPGGGGGGTQIDDASWANGGGGGGYSKTTTDPGLKPGQVIVYAAPVGGKGGSGGTTPGTSTSGEKPSPCWIGLSASSPFCLANPGSGGLSGGNPAAAPGGSTVGAVGDVTYAGGNGGVGTGSGVGTGGGSAGPDGPGTAGITSGDDYAIGGNADGGKVIAGANGTGTSSDTGGSGGGSPRINGGGQKSDNGGTPGGGGCGGFIWSGGTTDGADGGDGGDSRIVFTYIVADATTGGDTGTGDTGTGGGTGTGSGSTSTVDPQDAPVSVSAKGVTIDFSSILNTRYVTISSKCYVAPE